MVIFHQWIERHLTRSPTRRQHRHLAFEWDKTLQQQRYAAQRLPGWFNIFRGAQHLLTLAVVAQASRFQHRRQVHLGDGFLQLLQAIDRREHRGRNIHLPKQPFFVESILSGPEHATRWMNLDLFLQDAGSSGWHVFKIEGHDLGPVGHRIQPILVVVLPLQERRNLSDAGIGRRIEHLKLQSQRITGQNQHPRQLTTADDTDVHRVRLRGSG